VLLLLQVAPGLSDSDPRVSDLKAELVLQVGHSAWVQQLAFSVDGRLIASFGIDHKILIWDVKAGEAVSTVNTAQAFLYPPPLAFTPDSKSIVWADLQGIRLAPLAGQPKIIAHHDGITSLTVMSHGRTILYGDLNGVIYSVHIGGGEPPVPFPNEPDEQAAAQLLD
jgi:WD40 repeat protein